VDIIKTSFFSNIFANLRFPRQISEGKLNKTDYAAHICNYEVNLTLQKWTLKRQGLSNSISYLICQIQNAFANKNSFKTETLSTLHQLGLFRKTGYTHITKNQWTLQQLHYKNELWWGR